MRPALLAPDMEGHADRLAGVVRQREQVPGFRSGQPDFDPSAKSAPAPEVASRTSTVARGASAMILASSGALSTVNRRRPWAAA